MFLTRLYTMCYCKNVCPTKTKELAKRIYDLCHMHPSEKVFTIFCEELTFVLQKRFDRISNSQLQRLVSGKDTRQHKIHRLLLLLGNRNNDTTFMGDEVEMLDVEKLFITSSLFVHNVDDLVAYMIHSEDANIEPHDTTKTIPIWKTLQEKKRILEHSGLDQQKRQDYMKMKLRLLKVSTKVNLPPTLYYKAIQHIGDMAFLFFWNTNVKITYQCYAFFTNFLTSLDDNEKKEILHLQNKNGTTLQSIFQEKNVCNNGVAKRLMLIYLYHFRLLRKKDQNLPLPFYLKESKHGNAFSITVCRHSSSSELWSEEHFEFDTTNDKIMFHHMRWIKKPNLSLIHYMKREEKKLKIQMGITAK